MQKPAGLYQLLLCPDEPWHTVHIDIVMDLPEDEGCSVIMMVVDHFSKICSFDPLHSTTAPVVAAAFFRDIVAHHGLPRQ